jgi:hypothetical protein
LIRERHQIDFHNMVIDACAPYIYGSDYITSLEEIFERTGIRELMQEILVMTPRRFGKTTMVAMIAAALAAFIPGIKIGIYSISRRVSYNLMELVKRFLQTIEGAYERVMVTNKEELHISESVRVKGDPTPIDLTAVSKIYCYAASEKTTRGSTVDVCILEEAAHISEKMFNFIVSPLMSVENLVLLAITTPQDPTNYFSRLTTLVNEHGKPLFRIQSLGLACQDCLAKNMGHACPHMRHLLPKWRSKQRQLRVKAILGEHNKDVYAQELQGLIVSEGSAVFSAESISKFAIRAPHTFAMRPHVIYTFIDPHGGATQSSQALLSIARAGHLRVVIVCVRVRV